MSFDTYYIISCCKQYISSLCYYTIRVMIAKQFIAPYAVCNQRNNIKQNIKKLGDKVTGALNRHTNHWKQSQQMCLYN